VKGHWFTTVKVRFDPGPAPPKAELGDGVRGVEVGFSDDAAVIARVARLRLREQTFILVEEMGESIQAVLSDLFLNLAASWGWSPQYCRHRR